MLHGTIIWKVGYVRFAVFSFLLRNSLFHLYSLTSHCLDPSSENKDSPLNNGIHISFVVLFVYLRSNKQRVCVQWSCYSISTALSSRKGRQTQLSFRTYHHRQIVQHSFLVTASHKKSQQNWLTPSTQHRSFSKSWVQHPRTSTLPERGRGQHHRPFPTISQHEISQPLQPVAAT